MKPPARHFLGWERPALESAAAFLLESTPDGDLSRHLVVLPGARASRLLLGTLLEHGGEHGAGWMFSPPRFCTPGELGDVLLTPGAAGHQPAGPLMRRLAWIHALRMTPQLEPIVPCPPSADDANQWWHIAAALEDAHNELLRDLILFGEVPALVEEADALNAAFPDADRWLAAARVQQVYEQVLADAGLVDHSLFTLRRLRDEAPLEPLDDVSNIVLIGTPDLSRSARQLLARAVQAQDVSLTALVFAPESLSERFDELGAVIAQRWAETRIELPEILFAEGPADQAARVLESIARLDGRLAPHEIIIGTPDEDVVPHIERCAEQAAVLEAAPPDTARSSRAVSLRVRPATGTPLSQTAPLRLLDAVGAFLDDRSFAAFASLVRHPDIEQILRQRRWPDGASSQAECWLDVLDSYQAEHIPARIDGQWRTTNTRRERILETLHAAILELVDVLAHEPATRPLLEWAQPIGAFMARIYGTLTLSRNDPAQRRIIAGNVAIRDALAELESGDAQGTLPAHAFVPSCTAREAIDMLLDIAGRGSVPEEGDEDTIELLGWLELALDPAPAAIITGLNDGKVPANTLGDSFLPDSLRNALGISSNAQRYARDLYILTAVVSSRAHVALIAGRRAADNTPLAPSRLVFACPPQEVVERVRLYTGQRAESEPRIRTALRIAPGETNLFREMPRIPAEAVTSMRVTSFRTFLRSPYEFYLRDVLGLKEQDDTALELDPLAYGDLLHKVLDRFGTSDLRDATDSDKITGCLLDHLETLARQRFGDDPPTCIWLQLQFAQRRLREFAEYQAQRRQQGWIIEAVEWSPPDGQTPFIVDDQPFGLRGKIDRIERHEDGNRWAVLDYKTGDNVDKPGYAHRGRAGWRDLQLPLYRHLAAPLNLACDPSDIVLGYIALPKAPGDVDLLTADWTHEDLAEADDVAREVIRRVRQNQFFDLGDRPPEDGIFSAICGVGFIGGGRHARDDGEEGDGV